jgi:hypothetical protein
MISLKLYYRGENTILAACDVELLGKKFTDGELQLEVNDFYKEKLVDERTFITWLEEATIINLVGKRSVALAVKAGIVEEENILVIAGIPHVQVVKLIK